MPRPCKLSDKEKSYLRKIASSKLTTTDLQFKLQEKFKSVYTIHSIRYYLKISNLPYKNRGDIPGPQKVLYTKESLEDFNFLEKGKLYDVMQLTPKHELEELPNYRVSTSNLRFEYSTDSLLVFKHKEGFLETFPKHNGLIKVKEVHRVTKNS